ncbi:MAG: 4-(cytidine 5'-diphospho)-2-C-methyl-D-erythritol kinase [Lachnospiraceae bacterium]
MNELTVPAYAKINLCLDVLNRRPDGYHTVRMIMQSLELHDTLYLSRTDTPGITLVPYAPENDPSIPWDERNLVYKAARLFLDTYQIEGGVHIAVDKQIPAAAGLAGGSSDAAAALKGLNALFRTNCTLEELQQLGVKLGADIPYCLLLGTALSEGIGEILTPLPAAPHFYCALVKPIQGVSTKYVYEHLNLSADTAHPDTDVALSAIHTQDKKVLCASLGNILEPVAVTICPEVKQIEAAFLGLGADGVLMSGSGPTVFGLFETKDAAFHAAEYFCAHGYPTTSFATEFYTPEDSDFTAHS